MAIAIATLPVALPHEALGGSDWADAYRITIPPRYATARQAAEAGFARFPAWAAALMVARNLIMRPFGLKTDNSQIAARDRAGIFPVVSETPERVVLGMDDKHLDFRCVVNLVSTGETQQITVSTVIRRHNCLGRTYLAVITPFHRLIVRSMMRRIAQ
jgi:hypothetical protein